MDEIKSLFAPPNGEANYETIGGVPMTPEQKAEALAWQRNKPPKPGLWDQIVAAPRKAYVNAVPANARVFGEVLAGRERPIGAEDFSEQEMDVIRQLAKAVGKGPVDYDTYGRVFPDDDRLPGVAADPVASVRTTLGQFMVSPGAGGYEIDDTYDFNPNYPTREASQEAFTRSVLGDSVASLFGFGDKRTLLGAGSSGLYEKMRLAGEAFGPRGEPGGGGVPVQFTVRP